MKDTEAWAAVWRKKNKPWIHSIDCTERHVADWMAGAGVPDSRPEPVVIVSKARYDALTTCERIVHGQALKMTEERGAEGETKEAANV